MVRLINLSLLFLILSSSITLAMAEVIESYGEAEIVNNDANLARTFALSRARWKALESISGIKVPIDAILTSSKIADEVIAPEIGGKFEPFSIMDEGRSANIYWVKIKVKVDKESALKQISLLAKNTAIAVIFPGLRADRRYDYEQPFQKAIVDDLRKKGFDVYDIAIDANRELLDTINRAISTNKYDLVNFISNDYFAQNLLIGKVRIVDRSKDIKGEKVALIDAEIDWRLIGNTEPYGKRIMIASGTFKATSSGDTLNKATKLLYSNIAENIAPRIANDVEEKLLLASTHEILVVLSGVMSMRNGIVLRNYLRSLPFVSEATEKSMDTITVKYPNKSYYLGAIIDKSPFYKLVKVTAKEIVLERR